MSTRDAPSMTHIEGLLRPARKLLTGLAQSDTLTRGDIDAAIRQVTETASQLLDVERTGVWVLAGDGARIDCVDLFQRGTATHATGGSLAAADYPHYFEALARERTIAAEDAYEDRRTSEFAKLYLPSCGVGAMLDAPVYVRGTMKGVICHEHVGGARRWEFWEELIAGTMADFVALVMQAEEHSSIERELRDHRTELRARVEAATADLRASEQTLRALFEHTPVALVVTSIETHTVLAANERAAEMFEVPLDEAIGRRAPDFYVHAEDRARLIETMRGSGRIERAELELKTAFGTRFWGLLSGQLITFEGQGASLLSVYDITPRKRAEEALRATVEGMKALIASSPVPFVLLRADDEVMLANARAADLFGMPLDAMIGRRSPELFAQTVEREEFAEQLSLRGRVDGFIAELVGAKPVFALIAATRTSFMGEPVVMIGLSDVTAQKEIEARLRDLATHDALTSAFNRRYFFEVAGAELVRARRYKRPMSIAMLDVDFFKRVNDEHGHAAGDEVLRGIVAACSRELRTQDVLARYGGEELVVLFPETDGRAARAVAERLRSAVEASSFPHGEASLRVTISGGVSSWNGEEKLEATIERADEALYRAKKNGRNRVEAD